MKFMDDENLSPSECKELGRDSRGRPLPDETTPTYDGPEVDWGVDWCAARNMPVWTIDWHASPTIEGGYDDAIESV